MIEKGWIELENDCFGPDKKTSRLWVMYLFIRLCRTIKRCNGVAYTTRKRTVISLQGSTKKSVIQQLKEYVDGENVVLLE